MLTLNICRSQYTNEAYDYPPNLRESMNDLGRTITEKAFEAPRPLRLLAMLIRTRLPSLAKQSHPLRRPAQLQLHHKPNPNPRPSTTQSHVLLLPVPKVYTSPTPLAVPPARKILWLQHSRNTQLLRRKWAKHASNKILKSRTSSWLDGLRL